MGKYKELKRTTPNISTGTNERMGIVYHHTAGSLAGSLDWLSRRESKAGYHVVIGEDGTRYRFAADTQKPWHAGKSRWRGRDFCNSFTLGVAFTGDTYKRKWTEAEMDSAVEFARERSYESDDVTSHMEVSPGRKVDIAPVWMAEIRRRLKEHQTATTR